MVLKIPIIYMHIVNSRYFCN